MKGWQTRETNESMMDYVLVLSYFSGGPVLGRRRRIR